jgi:predicted MFS family arabinose efflux permease
LLLEGVISPWIGRQIDQRGALRVMAAGFFLGAMTMIFLLVGTNVWLFYLAMFVLAFAHGFTTYSASFAAAVQLSPGTSRRHISIITFYGGVASSLIWLASGYLMARGGLSAVLFVAIVCLLGASLVFARLGQRHQPAGVVEPESSTFSWASLSPSERRSIVLLAATTAFEYCVFSAVTLMYIQHFTAMFGDAGIAVALAAIYGPFQVLGRVIEMRFGGHIDARKTGMLAFVVNPIALALTLVDNLYVAGLAMTLFGMANGVLTVTMGYVIQMYFRPAVYGRARGWINVPGAIGGALGPSLGGLLFIAFGTQFMWVFVAMAGLAALVFFGVLRTPPRTES